MLFYYDMFVRCLKLICCIIMLDLLCMKGKVDFFMFNNLLDFVGWWYVD